MREAAALLRAAAQNAHQHYTDAARLNVEMQTRQHQCWRLVLNI
jgi:hypothetical protein